MNKTKFGILATMLLIGVVLTAASPASAIAVKIYGVAVNFQENGKTEHGLVFQIPHNTPQYWLNGYIHSPARPFTISGVDTSPWLMVAIYPHSNPQLWEFKYRKQINSALDETMVNGSI